MSHDDFKTVANKLVRQWRAENLYLRSGADRSELAHLEEKWNVKLPSSFQYLYFLVNGMDSCMDRSFFSLWSLEAIAKNGVQKEVERIQICFGDFLIDSHRYYLELDKDCNDTIRSDAQEGVVTDSFERFCFLLLTDPDKLGLMPQDA